MENIEEKIADELFDKASPNDKNSFYELEKLAEDGNARAMSNLAQIYLNGFGIVESSYEKAVALFQKAADLNEVYALFRLGEFYRDAKYGFNQDGYKAAEYFIRAAENATPNGAAEGLRLAAEIYRYGKGGVAPDGQKALELYEKLDELELLGEAEPKFSGEKALFNIAGIYIEGCGSVRPDGLKALEYLNKAIERGDKWSNGAFYEIERIYRYGKAGLPIDGYKVIECLEKRYAYIEIAEIYRDGKYNVRADGYKAIEYFAKEAKHGRGKTFDEITKEYFQSGCDDGLGEANEYYYDVEKICNFRMPQKIAEIYLEGKGGVQPDGQRALEYLSQTAEGLNKAIELTKNFIENNEDVKQNYPGILRRFFNWSESNLKKVYEQIANIYHYGKCGVLPNGQKALVMYERLDEIELREVKNKGHFEGTALFRIVDIYAEGCGSVQIDNRRAVEYLIQAIERGQWSFQWLAEFYNEEKIDVEVYGHKLIGYFLKYTEECSCKLTDTEDDIFLTILKINIAEAFRIVAQIYSKLNDGSKALEYFLKAYEYDDDPQVEDDIERIYREGIGNLKPNGQKLMEFLTKKLAKEKSPNRTIIYNIAKIYEEGCDSIKPDMKKALEFYRKAAELGHTFAERKLVKLTGSKL